MEKNILFVLLLLVSVSGFGRRTYSLPKSDFIVQFNDSAAPRRIYCFNEKKEKVWLVCNDNTQLTLTMDDDKQKKLMLHTIKYKNEIIEAVEYNVMWQGKKISTFSLAEVKSFTVEKNVYEREIPYFNLDSVVKLVRLKNDSLDRGYSSGNEFVIYVKEKDVARADTLTIVTGACYNIFFKDKNKVAYGVVQTITSDSIYISNGLNENMTRRNKVIYTIYQYAINDITALELLTSGGYTFRKLKMETCDMTVKNVERQVLESPCWFRVNPNTGKINFYRSWLTKSGFLGIAEQDGRAVWYEGE